MEPKVMRNSKEQVELYDERGRLIGVITRPVVKDPVGPGREKVYLARRAERSTQHAA